MSIERDSPLNYQINVSNVITIGRKSMADFYISFSSTTREWKSPIIHGKVTKENTRYPWIFNVDSHQLTVNFHQMDNKNGRDQVVGSIPLILMKREGQQQFLIFGCTESNRGRKVAEVEFTYSQISAARSLSSNKRSDLQNEDSKRVSLEYTIEFQNYDTKKGLNSIPEQPEHEINKQSINSKLQNNDSLLQSQDFHPSKLETLKFDTNRNRGVSQDSHFQLNLIKEMEDATDRWYRNNFGHQKPSNFDFNELDNENSRMVSVLYESNYEYLNDLSFTNPHMELKNIVIHSDKKPRVIEIYSIDMDGSQLVKEKIASMEMPEGWKHEWSNAIRLPKEKKAYGMEIVTVQKERLQGLLLKDSNNSKSAFEIYNKNGKKAGKVNYSLKQMRKIQIQTMQLMILDPFPIQEERQIASDLDKSFLKSALPQTELRSQSVLPSQSLLKSREDISAFKNKNKLMKQIYLNRQRQTEVSAPTMKKYVQQLPERDAYQKSISNNAYLNRSESPPLRKKSARRNQFEMDPRAASHHSYKTNRSAIKTEPNYEQQQLTPSATNNFTPITSKKFSINSVENSQSNKPKQFQLISQSIQDHSLSEEKMAEQQIEVNEGENQLSKKIEQIKKIGTDLVKKAKVFPAKKFLKTNKYKTIIYQEDREDQIVEVKKSLQNSDSGQEYQNHKKSYREPINASREPINATPSFQSLLINNTFSKQPEKQIEKKPIIQSISQNVIIQNKSSQNQQKFLTSIVNNSAEDDSQEIPITRHKTADQNLLKAMIQQKQLDIRRKKQQNLDVRTVEQQNKSQKRDHHSLGINTERMNIINNVFQTSVVPTTPTQKRASPLPIPQELRSIDYEQMKSIDYERSEQAQPSKKQQIGSIRESMNYSHQTKYSSQTIQPATQLPPGKLNYVITSISVSYYENIFGNKFVKTYIPNKHYYETPLIVNSNTLFWKCNGFLFTNVHEHQDLYLQLYNSVGEGQKMLGRVIISNNEFIPKAQQTIVRAYLILQSKIVGETVICYESVTKNKSKKNRVSQFQQDKREVSERHHSPSPQNQPTTPIKRKHKKRNKTLNDSLTKFLRKNRKQKINRYIVNEYSRAHIDSRINPAPPGKYSAGKNIVIGRDIRFPFGPQDEHKVLTPGPGAYRQKSQFGRYNRYQEKSK